MRIIAGKYKRTPILTLEGNATRPTREMVKEALFSSLNVYEDSSFLDLFSGSGAIGLEALSRGVSEVVFNDMSREAVKIIKANLAKVKENRMVYNLPYDQCLRRLEGKSFNYVFCDPPYAFDEYDNIFTLIKESDLAAEDCVVVLETDKKTQVMDEYPDFIKYKESTYGINKLSYYKRSVNHD